MECQLEFFQNDKNEIEILKLDVQIVKESYEKVRKSIFAKHGDLSKQYSELCERLQILERKVHSDFLDKLLQV